MHRACPILAAAIILFPQPVSAADMGLSCILTDEDIVFVPPSPSGTLSVQRQITEKAQLAIKQSVLLTPAGSPCDRMSGAITNTNVDVTCSFPPEGIGRAAIEIQIDLKRGTITETWDMIEHDGSQSHFYKHGTCSEAEPPHLADRSQPASEPSTQIASRTASKPPRLQ